MTFLELCQEAARDSGTIAGLPSFTTTAAASGRVAQLVGWVRDAYIDIQNERQDWRWMVKEFHAPLTLGLREYGGAELGLTDLARFIGDTPDSRGVSVYDPTIGVADEGEIRQVPYQWYRQTYARGFHDPQRPSAWALTPAGKLAVGPTPDKIYWIRGEYRQVPQRLTLDGDVPQMPAHYHRLITAEAIRLMARSDEAFQVLVERSDQYQRLRNGLVIEQTPDVSFADETLG